MPPDLILARLLKGLHIKLLLPRSPSSVGVQDPGKLGVLMCTCFVSITLRPPAAAPGPSDSAACVTSQRFVKDLDNDKTTGDIQVRPQSHTVVKLIIIVMSIVD